ncbi:precorrin-6x reductase CbiJ (plasmid) [Peptoclostridium acidaminophilum DSM 3953]|uniref:Precorrin-6x reductase CbiJ n=1 Tax=Peptoclostridium acidaminophilum DSM 3953 TaxID=1286171 RepID=W8TIG1_PEPAC|nr:precorrin-6A reductase [Peptoclostridium acidaminophilum]AHM57613.1 precorrin-6x reductase CbiJ [Peptoclostridium acidaminophilum DSM 3953]
MILLLGGTCDSRALAELLAKKGASVLLSAATEYGESLASGVTGIETRSGRLTSIELELLALERGIRCILDATHPYAAQASKSAIECTRRLGIAYIRYERAKTQCGGFSEALRFDSAAQAADFLSCSEGNVLLTTGSNTLEEFTAKVEPERLYARVLPTSGVIGKCEALGIKPSRIIGMQGPFSESMNRELIRSYNISFIVTKDAGAEGGTAEKLGAAKAEGIKAVIINRPQMEYGRICSTIECAAQAAIEAIAAM